MPKFANNLTPATGYSALVKNIQKELTDLEAFVKRRTAEAYWKVGKFIHEHLLKNKERADYGSFVIENLAKDVDRDESTLARSLQFYRAYPIVAARQLLTWDHYRALITVKDKAKREKFEKLAVKKDWTSRKLYEAIRLDRLKLKDVEPSKEKPKTSNVKLTVNRSQLFTYRILEPSFIHPVAERLVIDLGFTFIVQVPSKGIKLKAGEIVESVKKDEGYSLKISSAKPKDLYTYKALVERVIDADTLLLEIDLRFFSFTRQRVRLRGIDAPELSTKEGKEAKKFVEARLKEVDFVIVKTYKSDKYDRYLSDIFYLKGEGDLNTVLKEGTFLNQELLDLGFAVGMK